MTSAANGANGAASSKKYNIPVQETASRPYNHINGSVDEILARFCVAELCQCWPVYRDSSEWRNYRDAFADDAHVFTTWSGGLQIDDFIEISKKGRSAGDFIMHRVNGVLVDLNLAQGRAVGKMKATITQRFTIDGIPCDVDCDNRFIFFCKKFGDNWKTQWVKLIYEKDKLVPVDGKTVPHFPQEQLSKYTEGYQYLAVAQAKLGHPILHDLPNANNKGFFQMYEAMDEWLQGKEINMFWEKKGASYDLDELDNVHGFGDSSLPPEQIGNYLTEGDPLLRGIHLLMFGPWLEIFAFLRGLVPSSFHWPKFNFITLHYLYMITLTIIGSVIFYPAGNLRYIDCLFFASGAATQSGLNTVNINGLYLYQQVAMMLMTCVATPIFINTFVVFVRLYWFEKRFQNVVLESQRIRRTRERSRTRTEIDDRHLDLEEKGLGSKKVTVLHPDPEVIKEVEEDEESGGTKKRSEVSDEPSSTINPDTFHEGGREADEKTKENRPGDPDSHLDGTAPAQRDFAENSEDFTKTAEGGTDEGINDPNTEFHRDITFADELKPARREDSNLARMPMQRSTEQHIEFLEKQRNEKDKSILYIPGPRDFDRGDKPKQLEDDQSTRLERAGTTETFPSLGQDACKTRTDDQFELNGDDHPSRDCGEDGSPVSPLTSRGKQIFSKLKDTVPSKLPAVHHRDWATRNSSKTLGRQESLPQPGLRQRGRTGTLASFLTTRSEERDPMPYLSYQPTLGRNSMFVNLTEEQREELGGIEYRALKLLAAVLSCYYAGFHIFGLLCYLPYISRSGTYKPVIESDGVNPLWWGVFTPASMFNDLGFTLTPDSMESFQYAIFVLLIGSFLIIIGNTGFPCMLRFVIWVLSKIVPDRTPLWEELQFLLDHPRRCFTLLFPSNATWWLFWVLVALNALDLIFYIVLDLNDPAVTSVPVGIRILNGWFQAASTRTAGFAVVNLSNLHPAVQVSYLIMMYISIFPIAISVRRTNVYEEKSLGVYNPANAALNDNEDTSRTQSYVGAHLRRQLSFDLWYVFLGLFIIAIVEGDRLQDEAASDYAFNIFAVLFEVVSAYGTVGLSLGFPNTDPSFSGQFRTLSKLVIIAMQLRGRHRGLPYALDKAILLPGEGLRMREEEEIAQQARVMADNQDKADAEAAADVIPGPRVGTPGGGARIPSRGAGADEGEEDRSPLQKQGTVGTMRTATRTATGASMATAGGGPVVRHRSRGGLGTLLSQALSAGPTIAKRD